MRAKQSNVFDEIWVNSEHEKFKEIALEENVQFHKRPEILANNEATSEDFIYEFLINHNCDYLVQLHSIAPLLSVKDIQRFSSELKTNVYDVLLSVDNIQIECAYKGKPVNFTYSEKTNSQDLEPIQRITWSISAWRRLTYIDSYDKKKCATYNGKVGYYPINTLASHIIKTQDDLDIANKLWSLVFDD